MRFHFEHSLHDLAADLAESSVTARKKMRKVVVDNIAEGRKLARANSRRTSGTHGKRHPNSITSEMTGPTVGEWGPDRARPQGNMDFEYGSGRQSTPHLPVTHSGDVQIPKFRIDAAKLADDLL